MELEHIRLFLNKHMRKRKLLCVESKRFVCYLKLCGGRFGTKLDVYNKLATVQKHRDVILHLWLHANKPEPEGFEFVTSTALVFSYESVSDAGDAISLTCRFVCNGRYIKVDELAELFDFTEQLLPSHFHKNRK